MGLRGTYSALGDQREFHAGLAGHEPARRVFSQQPLGQVPPARALLSDGLASALLSFDDPTFLESNGKTRARQHARRHRHRLRRWRHHHRAHPRRASSTRIAGGNGHFRAGFYDKVYNIIDLYETALKPYGLATGMARAVTRVPVHAAPDLQRARVTVVVRCAPRR